MPATTSVTGGAAADTRRLGGRHLQVTWPGHVAVRPGGAGCTESFDTEYHCGGRGRGRRGKQCWVSCGVWSSPLCKEGGGSVWQWRVCGWR